MVRYLQSIFAIFMVEGYQDLVVLIVVLMVV